MRHVLIFTALLTNGACIELPIGDDPAEHEERETPSEVKVVEQEPRPTSATSAHRDEPQAETRVVLDMDDVCADLDPREFTNPEEILLMLECASRRNGVPMGIQFAIWTKESDAALYGDFGRHTAISQYRIRDCWKPGRTTRRPEGCENDFIFRGEMPDAERWKQQKSPQSRLGNGTRQIIALRKMARVYGWNPRNIKGSKGRSTLAVRRGSFGGCIGPKQITPSEWIREENWQEYDPLNAYHAMILTSRRLQRHHDLWLERHPESTEQRAWRYAIERYIGNAGSRGAYGYYSRVVNGERGKEAGWKRFSNMGWRHFTEMREQEDFSKFHELARKKYANIQ